MPENNSSLVEKPTHKKHVLFATLHKIPPHSGYELNFKQPNES